MNLVTVASTFSTGNLTFDPAAPIEDARARIFTSTIGMGRTLDVAGRSAQIAVAVPYAIGHFEGRLLDQFLQVSRSGLADPVVRFGVNVRGAPAMSLKEFAAYRPTSNVGVSFTVQAPFGQYNRTKLVTIGTNRWAFKPEVGFTRVRRRWTYEVYGGAWFFTDNTNYFGGGKRQQAPIVSTQFHLLYTFRQGMWVGGDINFWSGGRVTVNGIKNLAIQKNSRVGVAFAMPIKQRHSVRFSYSAGAYTRVGGDFQSLGVSYAYVWGGGP
jgi:hypothetical protein